MKRTKSLWVFVCFLAVLVMSSSLSAQAGDPGKATRKKPAMAATKATDDASIASAIKEKFADTASMKDTPVDVNVKDGVVTLSGKAKAGWQKGLATRMSKAVPGVKKVENNLVMEGSSTKRKK
jgi:osmotically-inducible protein OsmY